MNIVNLLITLSFLTDQAEVDALKRAVKLISIFLVISILVASVAVGLAVYGITHKSDETPNTQQPNTQHAQSDGSACIGVTCEHGGTCQDLGSQQYICLCVASFYGRHCQHGKFGFLIPI